MSVFAVIILGLSGLAGVMILGFALILGKLSASGQFPIYKNRAKCNYTGGPHAGIQFSGGKPAEARRGHKEKMMMDIIEAQPAATWEEKQDYAAATRDEYDEVEDAR